MLKKISYFLTFLFIFHLTSCLNLNNPAKKLDKMFPELFEICSNQFSAQYYENIQSQTKQILQYYAGLDRNYYFQPSILTIFCIIMLAIIAAFMIFSVIRKCMKKQLVIRKEKILVEKFHQKQNKVGKIVLKIFLILVAISVLLIAYQLYHTQIRVLSNSVICMAGAIETDQISKDAQDYTQYYADKFNRIRPLVMDNPNQRLSEVAFYSDKLLALINQSQNNNNNTNLTSQLKQTVKSLNSLSLTSKRYYWATRSFNNTIQDLRRRIHFFDNFRIIAGKYISTIMSLDRVTTVIEISYLIFMLPCCLSLLYIAVVSMRLFRYNEIPRYINSSFLPFGLFCLSICWLLASYVAGVLCKTSGWAYFYGEGSYTDKTFLGPFKLSFPYVYRDTNTQVLKLLINDKASFKDIYKGELNQTTMSFYQDLLPFESKNDDYLLNLFNQAENLTTKEELERNIYNYYYVKQLLTEKSLAKSLMVNIKQSLKALQQIMDEKLYTNPKMFNIQRYKMQNRRKVKYSSIATYYQSERTRKIYLCLSYLTIGMLICQMIIQRSFVKVCSYPKEFEMEVNNSYQDEQMHTVQEIVATGRNMGQEIKRQ